MSVDHYENFPVASWLCPASLRPAVKAIYVFARTADDIADEGDAPAAERLASLAAYRRSLRAAVQQTPEPGERWPGLFEPLRRTLRTHPIEPQLLHDLLDAFEQDVRNPVYRNRDELLDYCRRSANPVGRLLLQLYGVQDTQAMAQSDAICTALQLINFWQDAAGDLARGRCYFPTEDMQRHGLDRTTLRDGPQARALLAELCDWSRSLMLRGAPLVHLVPGRAGWELRLVVQGGLRVLEKIRRMHHATLAQRPTLSAIDAAPMLLRALSMRVRA